MLRDVLKSLSRSIILIFLKIVQLFYTYVFTKPKETYSKVTQLEITFASGYTAGVICAIVSHPADSLVSLLGKPGNKSKSLAQIISETGWIKLATKVCMFLFHSIIIY